MDESQGQFQAELYRMQVRLRRSRLGLLAGGVLGLLVQASEVVG